MPKNIVVMPTLKRPEFLALALEKLSRAQYVEEVDVRICLDDCPDTTLDEVEYVRDTYFPTADILRAKSHVAALSGCWNILHALKSGYDSGANLVFLVEEDVMVYPDYFDWHVKAHEIWDLLDMPLLATCGRYCSRYLESYYTNPGACLSRALLTALVPHINDEFFADRRGYMDRTFGIWEEASDLDDGLIRRVIRATGATVRYPTDPAVAHQGYHQYGRSAGNKTSGTITERIEQLRLILAGIDSTQRYYRDFEPYDNSRTAVQVQDMV